MGCAIDSRINPSYVGILVLHIEFELMAIEQC